MILDVTYVVLALVLLFAGAEGLVRGSGSLALRVGLSRLSVGLTIVAFGTSSPELVVSLKAALSHHADISIGNVVGSNTFNIGVILGITALVCPIPVHWQVIKIDAPIALGAAVLPLFLFRDHVLGRLEGAALFAGIIAYVGMNAILGNRQYKKEKAENAEEETLPGILPHWGMDVAFIAGGLGVLVLGSRLLVDHSVALARAFHVSEALIGLTLVAAGTSMPELATSFVAALRKQPDIAIGNIVGSNIFNILAILGLTGLVSPLQTQDVSLLDYMTMIGFTLVMLPMLYTGRLLQRMEGAVLLISYVAYLWVRGSAP